MASASAIDSAPAIGIDLGTTYSCVGVFRRGSVEIIGNNFGSMTTPSYVAFAEGQRFIGEAAKSQEAQNPSNTVFDAKRLIGRLFDDDSVQSDMKNWPFEVVQEEGKPRIRVEHKGESKTFYPEEISAMVLAQMKKVAEDYLGQTVTKAVITVPARFNNSQRQATKDAASIAGLDVLRLLSEPTSAALAYGLNRKWLEKRSLLVFDLGGGTLDVSVVTVKERKFDVIATAGDTHLGGNNFDNRMVDHFAEKFKRKHNRDLTSSKSSLSHLRAACERAKRALSWNNTFDIDIPYLFEGVHFHSTISGNRFDALNADLFRKSMTFVEKALSDANMKKADVDDIVLVGGSTRIPKIQILLQDFFKRNELCKDINPDEAVAYGAAVQAAILNGDQFDHALKLRLQDVTPLSLGIGIVDPMYWTNDEVVNKGLIMNVMIKRNTAIPARYTTSFTTVFDNQTEIDFNVYEGEHKFTSDNNLLGQFTLRGIQIADIKVPTINVTLVINSDGILKVSAVDARTGASNQLTITNDKDGLSEEEIRRMVRDAEKFKEDNEKQKSRIAAKIALEDCALRFMTEVESDTAKGKLSESYRKKVLRMVNDTLDWSDRNQLREIDEFEDMQRELTRIIQLGENDGFEDVHRELTRILQLAEDDCLEDKEKELEKIGEPISA